MIDPGTDPVTNQAAHTEQEEGPDGTRFGHLPEFSRCDHSAHTQRELKGIEDLHGEDEGFVRVTASDEQTRSRLTIDRQEDVVRRADGMLNEFAGFHVEDFIHDLVTFRMMRLMVMRRSRSSMGVSLV